MLIIDCHGHQTIVPQAHLDFRNAQKARLEDPRLPAPDKPNISDDEIREGIEANQLGAACGRRPNLSGLVHCV